MPQFKSLADRQADRAKSLQRQADRAKQIATRRVTATSPVAAATPCKRPAQEAKQVSAPPPVAARVQQALIPLFRDDILALDNRLDGDLAKEQAVRHWIDLGNSTNTPFDQLRPQAPLRESAFKAFAQVLGFSSLEAAYQWQRVIMAVRNSRRLDGRHVSDIYAYMLLQPESAMANSGIKRQTLATLFDKARSNVVTVEHVSSLREVKK